MIAMYLPKSNNNVTDEFYFIQIKHIFSYFVENLTKITLFYRPLVDNVNPIGAVFFEKRLKKLY